MTAGSGLLHIEAPPEELVVTGGLFHGIQLWVNLPAMKKMTNPRYQNLETGNVKLLTTSDGGTLVRLIAGSIGEVEGPGSTHTPISVVHATVQPGASMNLPWRQDFNALAYVLSGDGHVGVERNAIHTGQLAVFGKGDTITLNAAEQQDSRHPAFDVILLGGEPIREPVAWHGPFVMNTRSELLQAFEDFQAGRLGVIPA